MLKKGVDFNRQVEGGHQEKDKRAGTENVPAIVGMGKAIELADSMIEKHNETIRKLRDYYEKEILEKIPNCMVNGNIQNRLPGNSNICFRGVKGDSLLMNLDLNGICVSTGSACSSGSLELSHVLTAIGLSKEEASSALRVSIGKYNTKEEVDYLVQTLIKTVERLRKLS